MVYLSFSPQVMKFEPLPRYTGGSTPLYKPYRYVPPHREGVLGRFGLKTDIHFAHFDLESGLVFEGATYESVYERIYRFNERKKNMRIWNGFE